MQRWLDPLFQNVCPLFLMPSFFQEYPKPLIRIDRMVNEHTVDYYPSPLGLTSMIHFPIFLQTLRALSLPLEYLFNFLSNLYIPPWKISNSWRSNYRKMHENASKMNQKTESILFYWCLSAKLSSRSLLLTPRQREITNFLLAGYLENWTFLLEGGGGGRNL